MYDEGWSYLVCKANPQKKLFFRALVLEAGLHCWKDGRVFGYPFPDMFNYRAIHQQKSWSHVSCCLSRFAVVLGVTWTSHNKNGRERPVLKLTCDTHHRINWKSRKTNAVATCVRFLYTTTAIAITTNVSAARQQMKNSRQINCKFAMQTVEIFNSSPAIFRRWKASGWEKM